MLLVQASGARHAIASAAHAGAPAERICSTSKGLARYE